MHFVSVLWLLLFLLSLSFLLACCILLSQSSTDNHHLPVEVTVEVGTRLRSNSDASLYFNYSSILALQNLTMADVTPEARARLREVGRRR